MTPAPLSPAQLAPGPQELAAETAEMDARLSRMDAIGTALGRVHVAWGEQLARGESLDPCRDPAAASLVARSRAFGTAYRDAVQSARAELDRMERLWVAPTLLPLLDGDDHEYAVAVREKVDRHVQIVLEDELWHAKFVEPTTRACDIELTPVAGIAWTGARAVGDSTKVAIVGVGGGLVCPANVPADGRVVVTDGVACWDRLACNCDPSPVEIGQVIGPDVPISTSGPTP